MSHTFAVKWLKAFRESAEAVVALYACSTSAEGENDPAGGTCGGPATRGGCIVGVMPGSKPVSRTAQR